MGTGRLGAANIRRATLATAEVPRLTCGRHSRKIDTLQVDILKPISSLFLVSLPPRKASTLKCMPVFLSDALGPKLCLQGEYQPQTCRLQPVRMASARRTTWPGRSTWACTVFLLPSLSKSEQKRPVSPTKGGEKWVVIYWE